MLHPRAFSASVFSATTHAANTSVPSGSEEGSKSAVGTVRTVRPPSGMTERICVCVFPMFRKQRMGAHLRKKEKVPPWKTGRDLR